MAAVSRAKREKLLPHPCPAALAAPPAVILALVARTQRRRARARVPFPRGPAPIPPHPPAEHPPPCGEGRGGVSTLQATEIGSEQFRPPD